MILLLFLAEGLGDFGMGMGDASQHYKEIREKIIDGVW